MAERIAVLGGLFDPPHLGHFLAARQALESKFAIDLVYLMPAYQHPWRDSFASWEQRLAMTAFLANTKINVDAWEIRQKKTSYTIETVNNLLQRKDEYFWLIGSDALATFHQWKEYKALQKLIKFLVFPRVGFPIGTLPRGFYSLEKSDLIATNISSTILRERIKNGQSITNLVPEKVEAYIRKKHLYQ